MLTQKLVVAVVLACFTLGMSSLSFGQDKPQSQMGSPAKKAAAMGEMSPELRKDMADMYQKMADCLRTGKSMEDCQQQTAKGCPVAARLGYCPLHDGMGGKMGAGGMRPGGGMDSMKGHK